jgi:hypothetical protein
LQITRSYASELAVQAWPRWCAQQPNLCVVAEPALLDAWLRAADPAAADQVLQALVQLAARDGGDDEAAATVMAWVMLPAAARVAGRLAYLDPDIDFHVAAQLWLEIRSFTWRTTTHVASNLAHRVRKAVTAELIALPVVDADALAQHLEPADGMAEDDAVDELIEVLEAAVSAGTISEDDRLLLLDVIVAAAADAETHLSLWGEEVSARVGVQWNCSSRTIRRRTSEAVARLKGTFRALAAA